MSAVLVALQLHWMSAGLKLWHSKAKELRMSEEPRKNLSREERLAVKLRENLRRRKAQARAASGGSGDSDAPTEGLSNRPRES
ncbi:hypothetical protein [Erythrobacter sanguineus]|jgi:hypothetical protein|uniref:Uncharacterized protein n=1 Tax=Erythrobacter sanguineus TaxID=198312 RepID=A0A1M7T3J7_9SPHN|nr:hypothetical protein [Erythrobacter sanguineus]SHN65281.1 hypothetical protein SAMN02745193_02855 [Erythrobacter sanguineus]